MGNPKTDFMNAIQDLTTKKSLDKITVDDLCNAAGYSRQTFYRHYTDKYDLVFSIYQQTLENRMEELDDYWDFDAHCKTMLACFSENRAFYKKAFTDSSFPSSFHDRFIEYSVRYTIEAIGKHKVNKDIQILIRCWVSNTISLVEQWTVKGMEKDEQWLVDMFRRLMPEEVKALYLN